MPDSVWCAKNQKRMLLVAKLAWYFPIKLELSLKQFRLKGNELKSIPRNTFQAIFSQLILETCIRSENVVSSRLSI